MNHDPTHSAPDGAQDPLADPAKDGDQAGGASAARDEADLEDGGTAEAWATRVRSFVEEATRLAKEDLADKEVTFDETVERAELVIRKQPLAAVGIAAGVGVLAGMLISRGGRG